MPWVRRLRRGPQIESGVAEPPPPPASEFRKASHRFRPRSDAPRAPLARAPARDRDPRRRRAHSRDGAPRPVPARAPRRARGRRPRHRGAHARARRAHAGGQRRSARDARGPALRVRRPALPGAHFCSHCGRPATATKALSTCAHCGEPLPADTNFCPACGHSVAADEFSAQTEDLDQTLIRRWSSSEAD